MALVPVLNQLYSALNSGFYSRWYYMPMLFAAIMSLKALEDGISFKPGIISCGAVVGAMIAYQIIADTEDIIVRGSPRSRYSLSENALLFAITIISLLLLIFILREKNKKDFIPKLYLITALCSYMCFGIMFYRTYSTVSNRELLIESLSFTDEIEGDVDTSERISIDPASTDNANLIWGLDSTSFFNSLYDKGYAQLLENTGLTYSFGSVTDDISIKNKPLADLTSVKYYFAISNYDEYEGMEQVGTKGAYTIYENSNYIPMGFTYDSMISRSAVLGITDKELRQKTYLKALVVEDTEQFKDLLTDISDTAGEEISDSEYESLVENRRESAAYSFEKDTDGFTAEIDLPKENVVFFSVSYNENWSAYVDGEPAEVYNVNSGCIGVRAPAGDHTIRLNYTIRGLKEGGIITFCAAVSLAAYAAIATVKDRKAERDNAKAN